MRYSETATVEILGGIKLYFIKCIVLATVLALIGCSLKLPTPTHENDRDLTGKFDGKWSLESNTKIGNCYYNFKRAYMEVINGVGTVGPNGPSGSGFISNTGDFLIEVPYSSYRNTRFKYGGSLESLKGRVLIKFSNNAIPGCSVGLSIKKFN